jgi:ubiquinone biosynthesis protein
MLVETVAVVRDLSRLHEIASVLIRYGWGDVVRVLGLEALLERAGRILHWNETSETRHLDLPVRLRMALTELGPTFVKLGQLLATRVDMFPPDWIAEFEMLQSTVPPVPFDDLRPFVEKVFGAPVNAVFSEFDRQPFAAASIAQVHRARLADGTPVVVKIRRPDIERRIAADLRILSHLGRLLELEFPEWRRYQPTRVVAQFKRSLMRELDLVKEARNIEYFARNFAGDDTVAIPRVYWKWTHETVNVQDEMVGIPGTDLDAVRAAGLDTALLAARGADIVLKMILVHGYFHADPHPGNVVYLPGNRIALLDFGMVGRLTESRRHQIADLLNALAQKDEEGIVRVLSEWSGSSELDEGRLANDVSELVFSYDNLSLKDVRIGALLNEITALMRDNGLTLPADLTLLFKALITLEGFGSQLNPDFHMIDHLAPFVENVIAVRYSPGAVLARARRGLKEFADIIGSLPRDMARLMRQARRGRVKIDLDLKRLDHFGHQIDHATNRLTMGILTASLVIGSSIIMTIKSGPTLFGLPLFGFLGFLVAFVNSLWILYSIWRSGKE